MHSCLRIPEIILAIAEFVRILPTKELLKLYNSKNLLALALTCRSFHEPAMSVLWTYTVGLKDLMKCFPEDVCRVDSDSESVSALAAVSTSAI